jgi:hypothetical protein
MSFGRLVQLRARGVCCICRREQACALLGDLLGGVLGGFAAEVLGECLGRAGLPLADVGEGAAGRLGESLAAGELAAGLEVLVVGSIAPALECLALPLDFGELLGGRDCGRGRLARLGFDGGQVLVSVERLALALFAIALLLLCRFDVRRGACGFLGGRLGGAPSRLLVPAPGGEGVGEVRRDSDWRGE